jgi:hypothetical protein
MATVLPARQVDYSGVKRAAELIGRGFEQQQQMEAEQAFRLKLLDEQFKLQGQATRESQDYAASLAATSEQSKLEYQSDVNAQVIRVMQKYFAGIPTTTKTTKTRQPNDIGGDTTVPRGQVQQDTKTVPVDPMQEITPIYFQGKPVYYTDAELLQKGMTDSFWSPEEHRAITYAEQRNKKSIELLNKQIEAETALSEQRKKATGTEDLRAELTKAQTAGANIEYKIKYEALQRDTDARDAQDAIDTANLANIMTDGKYNDMAPDQQASIRKGLRAKDPKSDDPTLRASKLDKYKHFYDPTAREARLKFFVSSLLPKTQTDLDIPTEGQVQYKDEEGRVETATYLYDQLFKEYAQQSRFEEAQRLPNAIVQGMKMYTMDGALPIQLSTYQDDTAGVPKLVLTSNGSKVITAIRSLMSSNFEDGPVPLKDDQRAKLEAQLPDLENQGLTIKSNDSAADMYAKFSGSYQALADYYIAQGAKGTNIVIPQAPMMPALTGSMVGISPEQARDIVKNYTEFAKKNPVINEKAQAYKSAVSVLLGNVALADNDVVKYNLPNAGASKVTRLSGNYFPEYFGETPIGNAPDTEEVRVRSILGALVNDYTLDNGEYIQPTTLMQDLERSKILKNSPVLQRIILEYSQRYNSKNLPSIKK